MHKEAYYCKPWHNLVLYARLGSDGDVVPNSTSGSITTVYVVNIGKDLHLSRKHLQLVFFSLTVFLV